MVMLEPLISLIVCSCLGGRARRPGPDPTDWHGLVKGKRGREGGRSEVSRKKQKEGRQQRQRMKEEIERVKQTGVREKKRER